MASPYTIAGIPVTVPVDGGIRESEADGTPEAEVVFRCAYDDRFALVRALRGELIYTGGSTFTRVGGFAYPPSPNLICLDVPSVVGKGVQMTDSSGWPYFEDADVTARFGVPPYDAAGGQYWSLELDTAGEFVTLPGTSWVFVNGGNEVGAELARPMPQTRIAYTVHRLPFLPQDEIDFLQDSINEFPYRVGRKTYPKGTLMFVGARTSAAASSDGIEYACSYQIIKRPWDWNMYWNPTTYAFDYVSSDGTLGGFLPFAYRDFSILPV